MSAHAVRPGRVARVLVPVLGAVLVGLLALVVVPPAHAAAPHAADPRPAADAAPVSVRIVAISPQVLSPGEDLTVTVSLTNETAQPIEDLRAALLVKRFRMTSREEVAEWAHLGWREYAGSGAYTAQLEEPLAPHEPQTLSVTLPAGRVGLSDLPGLWGARGMAVSVASGGQRLGLARSYVLWNPTDEVPPRVPVAVVVPFVGPASAVAPPPAAPDDPDEGDGDRTDAPDAATTSPADTTTATSSPGTDVAALAVRAADDELDALTARGGHLRDLVSAAAVDPDVTVAVDPSLLVAAESGSEDAQWFAKRLRAILGTHEAYALPWADPDVAAVRHASQDELLRVAAERARESEGFERADLLLWAADEGTPDARTLGALATTGARAMVTSVPQEEPGIESVRPVLGADGTATTTIAPDRVLSDLVVAGDGPQSTSVSVAQRALAELSIVAREEPLPAGVVLATDRATAPDRDLLAAVVTAVQSGPWTDAVPLSRVLRRAPTAEPVRAPAHASGTHELTPGAVDALTDARAAARSFAEVLDDPDAYLAGIDDQVLAPLAVAWRAQPELRGQLVEQTTATVRARTRGLSIVSTSDLNVIATTSELRLLVRNELAVRAHARLVVDPRKACLTIGDFETPPLEPGDTAVTVPLEAHANCDVLVEVQLVGPSGQDVARPIALSARVTPTIESVGTVVVGILLALGLALGIVRTVRRGQSARRGARLVADSTAPVSLPVLGGTPAEEPEEPLDGRRAEARDDAGPGDGPSSAEGRA